MVRNRKVLILVVLIVVLANVKTNPVQQTVVGECFEKENCLIPIQEGYCEVLYDCIVGKCYHEFVRCPEVCHGNKDEDFDGLTDCEDSDCFDSIHCPCEIASHNVCERGDCYCEVGKAPYWVTGVQEMEGEFWCECY